MSSLSSRDVGKDENTNNNKERDENERLNATTIQTTGENDFDDENERAKIDVELSKGDSEAFDGSDEQNDEENERIGELETNVTAQT